LSVGFFHIVGCVLHSQIKVNIRSLTQPTTIYQNFVVNQPQIRDDFLARALLEYCTNFKDMATLIRACFAEFLACLVFVFMGACSVVSCGKTECDVVQYALSFGLCITVLAYGIGGISGGHINPAVTLSMVLSKNMKPSHGLAYFASQILGGIVGGGILLGAVGKDRYRSGIGLSPDLTPFGGCICEFMGTFILLFTVFFVAVEHSKRKDAVEGMDIGSESNTIVALAPLPIGFAVLIAHVCIGPLTGCGINPARVIGAVVWSEDPFPSHHWIYWVGPFLASAVAPACYFLLYGTLQGRGSAADTTTEAAITSQSDALAKQPNATV
jgi:MIP family channel proteins